jgi:hypothetical protein
MGLAYNDGKVSYAGNGSNTAFAIDFPYYVEANVKVKVGGVLKSLGAEYTISNGSTKDGYYLTGTVNFTFGNTPANGVTVYIYCETPVSQDLEFEGVNYFNTGDIEKVLDRLTMCVRDSVRLIDDVATESIAAAVVAALAAVGGSVSAAAASAAAASASASSASTSASTATTQSGISTTQAGISTTKASEAAASAILAGRYANYTTDVAIPGFPGEFSSKHFRDKTQEIFEALDSLTGGVYLAWESRTSNFTAVYGGRYLVDVSGLTANTTLTITPPSSPSILSEYEILCTNCTDLRSITFSNSPNTIEGYESLQLKMAEPFFLKMKWNTITSKWYPVLRKLSNLVPRAVSSNIVYSGGSPVKPNEILHVNTTSGSVTIDLPFGNVLPRIGDEVTIVDYFNNFDTNPCTLNTNGKLTNSTNTNIFINEKGFRNTFVYKSIAEGWMIN